MNTASRQIARAAQRTARRTTSTGPLASSARPALLRPLPRRFYSSSETPPPPKRSSTTWLWLSGAAVAAGASTIWYLNNNNSNNQKDGAAAKVFVPTRADYQKVYDDIAARLADQDDYDDGSYGPVLLRLAWHASGTYDKVTGTGGSNGATMRFAPESLHGANAGLVAARDFLEPVKAKFPWISYSDLWILAGITAIQEMQGPVIPFRPGRRDGDMAACTPDGRLPDAAKGQSHVRDIFYRMGFNDQEIVALVGAHALGRCHVDRSGYDGPWTFSPTVMTNDFFRLLVGEKWEWRKWDGPKQYTDSKTKSLMMLPADMALVQDKAFRKHVERYARDNDVFFADFSAAVTKLFELGVPFAEGSEQDRMVFKPKWDA